MPDAILAINAGSSSIKFALYAIEHTGRELRKLYHGILDGIGAQTGFRVFQSDEIAKSDTPKLKHDVTTHTEALQVILEWLDQQTEQWRIMAVGHRVVHGGSSYTRAVPVDQNILADLKAIIKLAPLHQPHALQALEVLMEKWPQIPHVACFDTMFHTSMPAWEKHFALPPEYAQQGIRRYGFHGLSYEYISSVLPLHLGNKADGKIVVAHLGHGVSMCALQQRQSIATTMSFTPLDGLPMGKRSGSLDPAVVLYLLQSGMSSDAVSDLLHHQSGLLGMSGISDDMRSLLSSADPAAADAVGYFCYRISRELGSLVAALGGLDALVFTGGIGEHAALVRARICEAAAWLGLDIDADANQANALQINAANSKVTVWVIPTNEERMLARHAAGYISEQTLKQEIT